MIGVIVGILLGCTFLDFLQVKVKSQNKLVETLSRFSLRRSVLQVLRTKINPDSFPALNGIRFLSICWVVMGHAYLIRGRSVSIVNKIDASEASILVFIIIHIFCIKLVNYRSFSQFINSLFYFFLCKQWFFYWYSVRVYLSVYAVDSFFTLSGFLMAYLFVKEMSNGGNFNIFQYYFHRYIRSEFK